MGLMNKTYLPVTQLMSGWVKDARVKLDMSQQDISRIVGYTQTFLSSLERGKAKFIAPRRWAKVQEFFVKRGVEPFDPTVTAAPTEKTGSKEIDVKTLKTQLNDIKKSAGSWKNVAEMLNVHPKTLTRFMGGHELSAATLGKVQARINKLTALPKQLADAGLISEAKPRKVAKEVRAKSLGKRPSIVENHEISTPDAIRMRLADVCRTERKALEGMLESTLQTGWKMNGKTPGFVGV